MNEIEKHMLAHHAYQAYADSTGNKNYQGLPMPKFTDLPEAIQAAWIAATQSVLPHIAFTVDTRTAFDGNKITLDPSDVGYKE